jgi:hypothetical protein
MKILLSLLLAATFTFADSFKVMPYIDLNMSSMTTTPEEGEEETTDAKIGFGGGVAAEITLVPMLLNLRTGLGYTVLNSEDVSSEAGDVDDSQLSLNTLTFPVMVVGQVGPAYAGLGVELAYILSAENENTYTSEEYPEDNYSGTIDLKDVEFIGSLDYSLQVLAGFEVAGFGPGSLNLEAYYNLGLANIAHADIEGFEVSTSSFGFRVGLALGI